MGQKDYRQVLQNEKSLAIFLRAMKKFDSFFCDAMMSKEDFTLRMEIHGNAGELLHARVTTDGFERPPGVEREIHKKTRD